MTFVHPTAVVEDDVVLGDEVRVWHFVHIRRGARLGDRTQVGKSCYVDADVQIGAGCKIQNFVSLYQGVTLEDDVFVGPSVTFTNDLRPRAFGSWECVPTVVRKGAALGANSTVVCGNEIGQYAMVAAGSVVTHSVGDYELVAGVPARRIGFVCRCGRSVTEPGDGCSHS
ncbi:MAG TPA: DapH/DapD/GlmU-related protein [Candidatus Dormibacteraeota bacterium]|nr:DapH/DapD/GlmU-related protein [Candidatus Dormibacteraeota bacterium]HVC23110.1 DapH/DapD/GlmU-related protein [Candidatus Dormibacteraeota bacterium]